MKNCNECEFCNGFDYEDGSEVCGYEGAGGCPFNDEETEKIVKTPTGFHIVIDGEQISNYIRDTIYNTLYSRATEITEEHIKQIVEEAYKEEIESLTRSAIQTVVDKQIDEFMEADITVGGGWSGPARTLSRTTYLNETVQEKLSEKLSADGIKREAERIASKTSEDFLRKLKDQINLGIKRNFDEATRQILTDNVVSLLMCNDTYQRLSGSMGRILGEGK